MRSMRSLISEGGFYKNVGAGIEDIRKFINDVPVVIISPDTKYDINRITRNPDKLTISIGSRYVNPKRDIIINFAPLIDRLSEVVNTHSTDHICIAIDTGRFKSIPDEKMCVFNRHRKSMCQWGPVVRARIMTNNDRPFPIGSRAKAISWCYIAGSECSLMLARYVEDYPTSDGQWVVIDK